MEFYRQQNKPQKLQNLRLCPCCSISQKVTRFYILTDPGLALFEPISDTLLRDLNISLILRADSSSYKT